MQIPIREEGLQIDAVLNMGNSLYAILLATVIGMAGVLIKTNELFVNTETYLRCISGGIFVLILIYYLIDWHDLNLVPFIDKYIGLWQMTKWMLCIILVTLSSLMALSGWIVTLALFAGFYHTPVIFDRDKEAGLLNDTVKFLWILQGIIILLSLLLLAFVVFHFFSDWPSKWFNEIAAVVTFICWAMALGCKIVRSRLLIIPKYKTAIQNIMKGMQ